MLYALISIWDGMLQFRNRKAYFYQSLLRDKHCPCSPTVPLWSSCFSLLSLTFQHLKIESTDGQIALFCIISFSLRFILESWAQHRGQVLFVGDASFFPSYGALMPASYTSRECALVGVCCLSWWRMQYSKCHVSRTRTLVTVEPDDKQILHERDDNRRKWSIQQTHNFDAQELENVKWKVVFLRQKFLTLALKCVTQIVQIFFHTSQKTWIKAAKQSSSSFQQNKGQT